MFPLYIPSVLLQLEKIQAKYGQGVSSCSILLTVWIETITLSAILYKP